MADDEVLTDDDITTMLLSQQVLDTTGNRWELPIPISTASDCQNGLLLIVTLARKAASAARLSGQPITVAFTRPTGDRYNFVIRPDESARSNYAVGLMLKRPVDEYEMMPPIDGKQVTAPQQHDHSQLHAPSAITVLYMQPIQHFTPCSGVPKDREQSALVPSTGLH